jgi:hypothetical protein
VISSSGEAAIYIEMYLAIFSNLFFNYSFPLDRVYMYICIYLADRANDGT